MKSIISLIVVLLSSISFAGGSVGNGGDSIVCRKPDGSIQSIELLDYYEGRVQRGFSYSFGNLSENHLLKIDRILQKLSRVALIRSKKYRELVQSFFSEAVLLPGVDLVDIPDSQNIIVAKNCKVEQLVIQQEPQLPGDKRYTISKDLWDLMDENQRAGLILHEIIYREAIKWGHENSIKVRYINALIASDILDQMDQKSFNDLLSSLNLPGFDMLGTIVEKEDRGSQVVYGNLDSDFFDSVLPLTINYKGLSLDGKGFILFTNKFDGTLNMAYGVVGVHHSNLDIVVSKDQRLYLEFWSQDKIQMIGSIYSENINVNRGENQITLFPGTRLYLDENENPLTYYGEIRSTISKISYDSGILKSPTSSNPLHPESDRFIYPSGVILKGKFPGNRILQTPQGPLEFTCSTQGYEILETIFSENGFVQIGHVTPGQKIRTAKGEIITNENKVTFDKDGTASID